MCQQSDTSKNIRKKLLFEMQEGIFSACDKLPRETVLAETLGISRTHLRDVLPDLEREGFITRRHGVGTLINRHVLEVKNRMDIETEFMDIIRQNGYEPGVAWVRVESELSDEHISNKLCVPVGTELVRICRLCTANGAPAIYCEDVLEKRLVQSGYTKRDLERPIFVFLKEFCGVYAYMDLTDVHAVAADSAVAEVLQIPLGTPLLNMEEVDYDIEGAPVFYSRQFFVDAVFRQTVLRKKL